MEELTRGLEGMRVLVVDDNDLSRYTALEMLRQAGLEPAGAQSGPAALAMLAREPYEMVLLDIQMPGMDGYETFRAIREIPSCRDMPVIALTGHATGEDRLRALEAGMDDHLGKPLDSSSLFAALRQHRPREASREENPTLSVLDSSRALTLLMGNHGLYARLLEGFVREYENAPSALAGLLAEGRTEDAMMLAHSVKGLAANLGGDQLAVAAGDLDECLRLQDEPRREAAVHAFTTALERFAAQARMEAARIVGGA